NRFTNDAWPITTCCTPTGCGRSPKGRRQMRQSYNPKNKNLLININGELIHRSRAGISPFDSVVQGGDAVWEGLRVYEGRIFRLREHLDRLKSSALALAFSEIPSHEVIIEEIC